MAQDTRGSKRKITDSTPVAVKKVKTAPSSDKPAPLKSALKKSKGETSEAKKDVVAGKEIKKSRDGKKKIVAPAVTPAIAKDEVELKAVETKTDKPTTSTKKASKLVKPTKVSKPAPVLEDHEADDDDAAAQLSADRTAELLAGFSSSEDEAEDYDGVPEDAGLALSSLPSIPDVKADLLRLTNNPSSKDPETTPGTIIISRLPHGFFESQMRAYFVQFGAITHLRLARNKKTGKSKHFAFVEFASSNVADI
ncbi:nucleolar protein, partial [Oleoguttula sp. CCFEE 5521]